jgi:hypothetical protein
MGCYVEEYEILGRSFGIEDYKDGRPADQHFMADIAKREKWPRFKCWTNGCGFDRTDTLAEARNRVLVYARDMAAREQLKATRLLNETNEVLAKLVEPAHLFRFEAKAASVARLDKIIKSGRSKR